MVKASYSTGIREEVGLRRVPSRALTHSSLVILRICSMRGRSNSLSALKKRRPAGRQESPWEKINPSIQVEHLHILRYVQQCLKPSKREYCCSVLRASITLDFHLWPQRHFELWEKLRDVICLSCNRNQGTTVTSPLGGSSSCWSGTETAEISEPRRQNRGRVW